MLMKFRAIKHENVLQHVDFLPDIPAIVMELAEHSDLNNFLLQRDQPIKWPIRMKWCMQLTNALLYLHQSGIVHRDIRCVNILLTKDWNVKISGS